MSNLLAEAISQGKTVWLKELLAERLPDLPTDIDGCQSWYNSLIETFEARNLIEPSQQKNYLTQARNAIKIIDPEHPALDVVKFETQTWIEINNQDSDRIASRDTKFISEPETIVEFAKKLLKSHQWSEIAAGLAVVTGRRSSEVIKTARFKYKSQYSVIFSGCLKRRGELVECIFEIPTLCEAELVIEAVANLREFLGEEINQLSIQQISGRYSRAVAKKCAQYFSELVPTRTGEDNLYTHLFRAVYATIASYWYCPPTVPEMEYRAAIQGHYQIIDEQNPELRRSLAAGRHYFDYKISDGSGNIDGRLGIKLGQAGVKIIEQFATALLSSSATDISPLSGKSTRRVPSLKEGSIKPNNLSESKIMSEAVIIPKYLISRLNFLSDKLEMNEKDTLEALFDWAEVSLSLAETLEIDQLKPNVFYDKVEELKEQSTRIAHAGVLKDISEGVSFRTPSDKVASLPVSLQDDTSPRQLLGGKLPTQNVTARIHSGDTSLPMQDREQLHQEASAVGNIAFDAQSINNLCSSVKILAEALTQRTSHGGVLKDTPSDKVASPPVSLQKVMPEDRSRGRINMAIGQGRETRPPLAIKSISTIKNDPSTKVESIIEKKDKEEKNQLKNDYRRIEAEAEINHAIDLIMEYNEVSDRNHQDKFRIGMGALRKMTRRGCRIIAEVIKSRNDEIEKHHQKHQLLNPRHNNKGCNATSIDIAIPLASA